MRFIIQGVIRGLVVRKSFKEGIVKFLENRVFGPDMDRISSTMTGV